MIEEEIFKAKTLHKRYGEAMLKNHGLFELMEKYRKAIETSYELMKEMGIITTCTVCAKNHKAGSCCFQGVEEWYDHILLLINFLLGIHVADSCKVIKGCLFVGNRGCTLLARHAFCINYLCPALNSFLTNSQKDKLWAVTGDELYSGWEVEKAIRHWIREDGNQDHS